MNRLAIHEVRVPNHGETYIVRFRTDQASEAIAVGGRWANSTAFRFNWYDAAYLSSQVVDRIATKKCKGK